jgi:hypothetical protein
MRQGLLVANPGLFFFLASTITLAAGSILVFLMAQLISRRGIGNGFCPFLLLDPVLLASGQLRGLPSSEGYWNPVEVLVWMFTTGLLIRIFARRTEATLWTVQQEPIQVTLPALPQGIVPVTWTYSLLGMFFTASLVFSTQEVLLWNPLQSPFAWPIVIILIAAFSLAGFHLFSSRKRLVWNLPSGALPPEGQLWTGRSLAYTSGVLVAFGVGFLGGQWFLNFKLAGILGFAGLVMLVALGFDVVAEWGFRRRHREKVEPAIEMDNVYCACYLQGVLARNGVDCLVRSFHFRSLSFFFMPIVKMELIVATADLERAREMIRLARIEIV